MRIRKRFSQRRADALYRAVHARITDLRIAVLKGAVRGLNERGIEEYLYKMLVKDDLGMTVVREYKRSYSKEEI